MNHHIEFQARLYTLLIDMEVKGNDVPKSVIHLLEDAFIQYEKEHFIPMDILMNALDRERAKR